MGLGTCPAIGLSHCEAFCRSTCCPGARGARCTPLGGSGPGSRQQAAVERQETRALTAAQQIAQLGSWGLTSGV